MNIGYATDSGYLVQTLVSAYSAVYWSSRKANLAITVLDCGMTNDEWSWFRDRLRLNMHFPLLPVHEIRLRCMANVLGLRKWQLDGVGFWKYVACAVKTRLVLFCLKFANVLPGRRGRYDEALRLRWAHEGIDGLVRKPCSDKMTWRTA